MGNWKRKMQNREGTGGAWKEVEGKKDWEKYPLCWRDGSNNCIKCDGTCKA